jgi:hypothetical protein
MLNALPFREVWAVDFEFTAPPGERPEPICLAARELKSGRALRLWRNEMGAEPPYNISADSLFVAYYASAEIGCHLALGWPKPKCILDLFTEFRCITNGMPLGAGAELIGALTHYGLDAVGATEKESMRSLALRGEPFTDQERKDLVAYCESDVVALERLLQPMLRSIDFPRALLRGRYMAAAASIERNGIGVR